jgi:hypothetical protein
MSLVKIIISTFAIQYKNMNELSTVLDTIKIYKDDLEKYQELVFLILMDNCEFIHLNYSGLESVLFLQKGKKLFGVWYHSGFIHWESDQMMKTLRETFNYTEQQVGDYLVREFMKYFNQKQMTFNNIPIVTIPRMEHYSTPETDEVKHIIDHKLAEQYHFVLYAMTLGCDDELFRDFILIITLWEAKKHPFPRIFKEKVIEYYVLRRSKGKVHSMKRLNYITKILLNSTEITKTTTEMINNVKKFVDNYFKNGNKLIGSYYKYVKDEA